MFGFTLLATLLASALVQAAPAADPSVIDGVADKLKLHARQGGAMAAVYSKCTQPNMVALTFDDGPYWWTQNVADQLNAVGGKGTFFVNGNNWACIYNTELSRQLKYAYDQGHQIASHTWAHHDLNTLTWDQIHHQMWLTEQAIMRITGAYPAFMRPPYGNYNNLVRQASYVRGQALVMWDVDSGDSVGLSVAQQKGRYDDIVQNHPSNALSLQHDVQQATIDQVLPHAISVLTNAGYQLVTVAQCLGMQPYQWVGAPHTRDASWTC